MDRCSEDLTEREQYLKYPGECHGEYEEYYGENDHPRPSAEAAQSEKWSTIILSLSQVNLSRSFLCA